MAMRRNLAGAKPGTARSRPFETQRFSFLAKGAERGYGKAREAVTLLQLTSYHPFKNPKMNFCQGVISNAFFNQKLHIPTIAGKGLHNSFLTR